MNTKLYPLKCDTCGDTVWGYNKTTTLPLCCSSCIAVKTNTKVDFKANEGDTGSIEIVSSGIAVCYFCKREDTTYKVTSNDIDMCSECLAKRVSWVDAVKLSREAQTARFDYIWDNN